MTRALRLSKAASALRVVERQQVSRFLGGVLQCFFELHSHAAAAAFRSDFGARMVDKNLAHDRGGEIKEVRLVLPVRDGSIDESNIGFVNQGRRLEREAGRLVDRVLVPCTALPQQLREIFFIGRHLRLFSLRPSLNATSPIGGSVLIRGQTYKSP